MASNPLRSGSTQRASESPTERTRASTRRPSRSVSRVSPEHSQNASSGCGVRVGGWAGGRMLVRGWVVRPGVGGVACSWNAGPRGCPAHSAWPSAAGPCRGARKAHRQGRQVAAQLAVGRHKLHLRRGSGGRTRAEVRIVAARDAGSSGCVRACPHPPLAAREPLLSRRGARRRHSPPGCRSGWPGASAARRRGRPRRPPPPPPPPGPPPAGAGHSRRAPASPPPAPAIQ